MPHWLEESPHGLRLHVHAQPGAKKTTIVGAHGDALKIKIHAPPVEGKANDELLRFLAGELQCKKNQITITAGALSREKTVLVTGLTRQYIVERLGVNG